MSIEFKQVLVTPQETYVGNGFVIEVDVIDRLLLTTKDDEIVCDSYNEEIFLPDKAYKSNYSGDTIDDFIAFMLQFGDTT